MIGAAGEVLDASSGQILGGLTGTGPGEAATTDLSGRCVGNSYVLVCPVGHGATGTVWRGIDRSSGEYVAVKLLHEGLLRQPKLVIRFVQERTILMMMRHENIVGVHDLFSVGGSLALVMDYVSGGSLRGRGCTRRAPCRRPRPPACSPRWRRRWPRRTSWAWCTAT